MDINKAYFSFRSKKPNFVVSAFDHRLVFGPVEAQCYQELKCFEIEYSDYHQLYIGFFPIVKFLSGKTEINEGSFLKKENVHYKWKVTAEAGQLEILLAISNVEEETNNIANKFSITFNLNEFNDLIYLLTELCFLSLDLSFQNLTIFITLSNFELSTLLTFQSDIGLH